MLDQQYGTRVRLFFSSGGRSLLVMNYGTYE